MSFKSHPAQRSTSWFACLFIAASTWSGVAGDKIQVYRVPKESAQAEVASGHSADDGHNHGTVSNPHAMRATPKVTYTTPEGWREAGAGDMRVAGFTITGTNGQTAQVAITPLPGMAGKEGLIVNMWRQQVGLSELAADEADKQLTPVDIGGEPGKMFDMAGKSSAGETVRIVTAMANRGEVSWFYKLQGSDELVTAQKPNFVTFLKSVKIEEAPAADMPAGHPPLARPAAMPGAVTEQRPPKPRQGGPTWATPSGWKEIDGGQFLFAKFLIAGDGGAQAAVNVSTSAGDGGGLAANVNRWRGQLSQSPWSAAELQKNVKEVVVAGGKANLVEMSGTDARTGQATSLVGAMVLNGGSAWFYKLMGDAKLVEAQKEAFTQFVNGVKY